MSLVARSCKRGVGLTEKLNRPSGFGRLFAYSFYKNRALCRPHLFAPLRSSVKHRPCNCEKPTDIFQSPLALNNTTKNNKKVVYVYMCGAHQSSVFF